MIYSPSVNSTGMLAAATPFLSIVTPVSYSSFLSSDTANLMSMFDVSGSRTLDLLYFLVGRKFDFIRWTVLCGCAGYMIVLYIESTFCLSKGLKCTD